MSSRAFTRFVFSPAATPDLPLLLESVGYNPNQEKIARPDGYPYYHWLQTAEGEGELTFGSGTVPLPPGSGILLPPDMPHAYEAKRSSNWETYYLTFGGAAAGSILAAFGIREAALFRWEAEAPLTPLLGQLLNKLDRIQDLFGLETSTEVYRFLAVLSQFGQVSSSAVPRNMEKLGPLLAWMEQEYGNPDIGLDTLAEVVEMSGRHLSKLFQQTFGIAPYSYLTHMRIHKAKEHLASEPGVTVAAIAGKTGFRDASHFVATFRKHTGMTPQQFRRLH
ncbi:AraC family transcriptional regulator [Paenibacillus sp. MBLB2552]|uniref:AraC family transcriptional regulator n=1 Tax=Paenibacillus mellifer TaxID=2937794 RepID=A0A9X2BPI0_9BACL|nr:AraC family transcriptional regulator [Paenibacillus mellifer]MCK8488059.1 AraC family transcriptional regulator [Paenibacillus mellifer]